MADAQSEQILSRPAMERLAVSWKFKEQFCVALSSTEAEYLALCQASTESVWMVDFVKNLGVSLRGPNGSQR